MNMPPVVSPEEWDAAREELLVKEKEHTRARDALAAQRRRMPRMAVEKEYAFEGPDGPASLLDLFDGRRQLIVYQGISQPIRSFQPAISACGARDANARVVSRAFRWARWATWSATKEQPTHARSGYASPRSGFA